VRAVAAQLIDEVSAAEMCGALQEFLNPNIQLLSGDAGGPQCAAGRAQQALDEGAEIILVRCCVIGSGATAQVAVDAALGDRVLDRLNVARPWSSTPELPS